MLVLNPTHYAALASYQEWLGQQTVAHNTCRVYYSRIKQFLLFLEYANLSDQPLNELTGVKETIEIYLEFLKQSRGSVKSRNANINALNNFAYFLGLKGLELKREHYYQKLARILNRQEQDALLNSIKQQESARDQALALVLLYTGLRIGDCAALNVQDIFMPKETSHHAEIAYLCLNSPGSAGRVLLNKSTTLALKEWLKERELLAHAQETTRLWLTKHGEPLSISGITFVIKRIGWQAKLSVCAETLRRTALFNATNLLNKNELAAKFGGYVSQASLKIA